MRPLWIPPGASRARGAAKVMPSRGSQQPQPGYALESMDADEAVIRTFVDPAREERLARYLASPADRDRLREELGHLRELHPGYRQPLPVDRQTPVELERLLRTMGA